MSFWDWLIFLVPLIGVMSMGIYCRRYIRNVSDFLAAGRVARRFVLCVSSAAASGMGMLIMIGAIEAYYKTGFALGFWNNLVGLFGIFLALTGFVTYRYREMKVLSFGQYIEIRYGSKVLRIISAVIRVSAEIMASMLAPAVAARFFIYYFSLPLTFTLFGWECSTYVTIVTVVIAMALVIILCGGVLGLMVTDCVQGLIIYPGMVCMVVFLLWKFSWGQEIAPIMLDRGPGESFLNPFDVENLRDFNLFALIVTLVTVVYQRASWVGGGTATAAKSSHEQKMAGVFGQWSMELFGMMMALLGLMLVTFFNHEHFAEEAKLIRDDISRNIIQEVVEDKAVQDDVRQVVTAIPVQRHVIGVDPPLTHKQNLDTIYQDKVEETLDRHGVPKSGAQEFTTLYHQLMLPFALKHMLPAGLLGIFGLMMICMMLSTDDSRIYCSGTTVAQDIILPFLKKTLTPSQHLWLIRICTLFVGALFLIGSICVKQLDYLNMFVSLVCALWEGGCAPVMLGGMYCRYGNKTGAFCSLFSGMTVSMGGMFLQWNWADMIYPWLERHQLVEAVGRFLEMASSPMNPLVVWEMNAKKCPVNSMEFFALAMIISLIFYILGTALTYKGPFNMEKMLHRGIYNTDNEVKPKIEWKPSRILQNLLGITPEYTKIDRLVAWFSFYQRFVLVFFVGFVCVLVCNLFSPWGNRGWSNYFLIYTLVLPGILSLVCTFIYSIGGWIDLRHLFRDLKDREDNPEDNGMVVHSED